MKWAVVPEICLSLQRKKRETKDEKEKKRKEKKRKEKERKTKNEINAFDANVGLSLRMSEEVIIHPGDPPHPQSPFSHEIRD